jgi:hypothetical protein
MTCSWIQEAPGSHPHIVVTDSIVILGSKDDSLESYTPDRVLFAKGVQKETFSKTRERVIKLMEVAKQKYGTSPN